jgi:hypothetical protein
VQQGCIILDHFVEQPRALMGWKFKALTIDCKTNAEDARPCDPDPGSARHSQ